MKNTFIIAFLLLANTINAQVFKEKGDTKGQVGLNAQDGGSGIYISSDFGIATNISLGITGNYLISVYKDSEGNIPDFGNRLDLKARFNANIGDVLKMNSKMDFYPGLDLGLHNFGGHLGLRYFLTSGFGLFGEIGTPIAKYKQNITGFDRLNNQFTLNIGASFDL